jgi:hypothetical protein
VPGFSRDMLLFFLGERRINFGGSTVKNEFPEMIFIHELRRIMELSAHSYLYTQH